MIRRSIHLQDHTQTPIDIGNSPVRGPALVRHGKTVAKHHDEEVPMVGKISTALAAILLLGSVGIASAQPARFDGWTYPHSQEQYCYMPSSPCDNQHT
jgi:hypothetical protein